jgi:hypothetical protein
MSTNPLCNPKSKWVKNNQVSTKLDLPLTSRNIKIRQDMTNIDGVSISWKDSFDVLRRSLEKDEVQQVFESKDTGKRITVEPEPRTFTKPWINRSHARILDGCRGMRKQYDDCSTVLLTLTGNPYKNGGFMAPLDYYQDLTESWSKSDSDYRPMYRKINNVMDKLGLEFEYLLIVGVHDGQKAKQSGSINLFYPHIHILLYINGDVSEKDFHSTIDMYLKHSPVASRNQHDYSDAIRIDNNPEADLKYIGEMDRERGKVTPAARDISSHLCHVGINNGQLTGALADKMFASMMFANPNRSWKPSQGFTEAYESEYQNRTGYNPEDYETDEEFEHLGIEVDRGNSIDFYETTNTNGSNNFTESTPIPRFYE